MAGFGALNFSFVVLIIFNCLVGKKNEFEEYGKPYELTRLNSFTLVNHHRNLSDLSLTAIHSIFCDNRKCKFVPGKPILNEKHKHWLTYLSFQCLLRSGDVSMNPGPIKYPCATCSKAVGKVQAL